MRDVLLENVDQCHGSDLGVMKTVICIKNGRIEARIMFTTTA